MTASPSWRAATSTRGCARLRLNLKALPMRLTKTWRSSVGSPVIGGKGRSVTSTATPPAVRRSSSTTDCASAVRSTDVVTNCCRQALAIAGKHRPVILVQRPGEAVDGAQRRAQVVGYGVAELLELGVGSGELLLDPLPLGHVPHDGQAAHDLTAVAD